MHGVSGAVLRIALVLPMAYEAYRLVALGLLGFAGESWSVALLLWVAVLCGLPALGLLIGCAFVVARWSAPWVWWVVAVCGPWIVYSASVAESGGLRPSAGAVNGVYAFLLAVAFLLAGREDGAKRGIGPPDVS